MKRMLPLAFSLAILGAPLMRADMNFAATGVFQSGAMLSGTVTLNTVTGLASSVDLFLTAPDADEFKVIQGQFSPAPGVTILQLSPLAMGLPQLILAFPVTDFTGYTGGVICGPGGPCGGVSNLFKGTGDDSIVSGSLSPAVTATPEPSLAWLLAAGMAALAIGRKWTHSAASPRAVSDQLSAVSFWTASSRRRGRSRTVSAGEDSDR